MPKEILYLLNILLAVLLGFAIGYERKLRYKEAGIRTHTIVCAGSALIMVVSKYGFADIMEYDASRVAAQIVSGIGFLGAGIIIYRKHEIHGLTTAAGVWATAGVGMAAGAGLYVVAAGATVILIGVQCLFHIKCKFFQTKKYFQVKEILSGEDLLYEQRHRERYDQGTLSDGSLQPSRHRTERGRDRLSRDAQHGQGIFLAEARSDHDGAPVHPFHRTLRRGLNKNTSKKSITSGNK